MGIFSGTGKKHNIRAEFRKVAESLINREHEIWDETNGKQNQREKKSKRKK